MANVTEPVTSTSLYTGLVEDGTATYADALAAYVSWAEGIGLSPTGSDYGGSIPDETLGLITLYADTTPLTGGSTTAFRVSHNFGLGLHYVPLAGDPADGAYDDTNFVFGPFMPGWMPDEPPTVILGVADTSATVPFSGEAVRIVEQRIRFAGDNTIIYLKMVRAETSPPSETDLWDIAYRIVPGGLEMVVTAYSYWQGSNVALAFVGTNRYDNGAFGAASYLGDIPNGTTVTFRTAMPDLPIQSVVVVEEIGVAQDQIATRAFPRAVTSGMRFAAAAARQLLGYRQATEEIGLEAVAEFKWYPGVHVVELLGVRETVRAGAKYVPVLIDRVGLRDFIYSAYPISVIENIGFEDAATVLQGVLILERLGFRDVARAAGKFGLTVVDTIRFADSLRNFFGAEVIETFDFAASVTRTARRRPAVVEELSLGGIVTPRLLVRVTAAENLAIGDQQALRMLLQARVVEGIEINVGLLQPNGSFTAWAVNTRTSAVTEYTGFEFNSFAKMGNKYVAASSEGLFELNGDDDDGAAIVAQIRSGLMQLNGTKLSVIAGAYLGMKGEGRYILRIIAGDGRTFDYAVETQSGRTTKVRMGKGLRARYFAFELIGRGEDFDLDTVEFVPLWPNRHV